MGVIFSNGRYVIRWTDGTGRRRFCRSRAATKSEANRLLRELQRQAERQRHGLEPLPPADGGGTLAELLQWWLENISKGSPSHEGAVYAFEKHFMGSDIAPLPLTAVTPQRIESLLLKRSQTGLAPQTVNHLRGYLSRAFNAARKTGRFSGVNPVASVAKRRVLRRLPDFLTIDEFPRVLDALDSRWQPLFAAAVYTGMRKGELAGLRKTDVDVKGRLLTVARSYDRDTTKGGHTDRIPIATELVPYLDQAIRSSASEYIFPGADGSMMRRDAGLEHVLRRALGRAGIVTGYLHVCRRKGCGRSERAADDALRRCPVHHDKLWPKAQVRQLRFHDLRHTTASLLMMKGANPAAVQRIMRHSDPKLTTEVYGHLAPEYLRAEVDRLSFGVKPVECEVEVPAVAVVNADSSPIGAQAVRQPCGEEESPDSGGGTPRTPGLLSRAVEGDRTLDLKLGKLVLCQLSYYRNGRGN
jgi:integrase